MDDLLATFFIASSTIPAYTSLPGVPYAVFRELENKGKTVMNMAHRRRVNITQDLNLYQRKIILAKALWHLTDMSSEIVKGGCGHCQGTYVSFDIAIGFFFRSDDMCHVCSYSGSLSQTRR